MLFSLHRVPFICLVANSLDSLLSSYNHSFLIFHRSGLHWAQLGSFRIGFFSVVTWYSAELDIQDCSVTWLMIDNGFCLGVKLGILARAPTWSHNVVWTAHSKESVFQERSPQEDQFKGIQVETWSLLLIWLWNSPNHNSPFSWFRIQEIQGAAQI